jgi:hypothetical protein
LRDAQTQAREALLDLAESQLYKKIEEGDLTSIIFALKTIGKSRGYVERHEKGKISDNKIHITFEKGKKWLK